MFVHISPEMDAIGETISTLKFAERVATVELGAARKNKEGGGEVKELKDQVIVVAFFKFICDFVGNSSHRVGLMLIHSSLACLDCQS